MEGPDRNLEVPPAAGSYFDRVLDRCRSYKQSLDQLLVEVEREIDDVVSEGEEGAVPDLAVAAQIKQDEVVALGAPSGSTPTGSVDLPTPARSLASASHPIAPPMEAAAMHRGLAVGRSGGHLTSILTTAYVLSGRYELVKCVTTSGCGMLFKALDRRKLLFDESSPYVAVEVLSNDFQRLPAWQALLQREATRLSALSHTNILHTFDFQRDGATVYVVMEYQRAVSLQDKIQHTRNRRLPTKDAVKILLDIGHALIHAHSTGMPHGDLRLSNVLITPSGTALVFDFGIAGLLAASHWQSDNDADLAFLSPDLDPASAPDVRDDVYSYGCICYLLLTGNHPFDWRDAKTASRLGLEAPRCGELNWVQWKALQRALNFNRNQRTPTIAQLVSEVTSFNFNPFTLSRIAGRTGLDWVFGRNRSTKARSTPSTPPMLTPALEHKEEPSDGADASNHANTGRGPSTI